MAGTNIPDTYNGEPTKYHLFDGFTHASTPMKALYIFGTILTGLIVVPLIFEIMQALKTKKNADAARTAIENERAVSQIGQSNILPDDNTPENTKYRTLAKEQAQGQPVQGRG